MKNTTMKYIINNDHKCCGAISNNVLYCTHCKDHCEYEKEKVAKLAENTIGHMKKSVEQIMIEVAKKQGIHEVLPNDKQLLQWTVNRLVSGDKCILSMVEQRIRTNKIEIV